MGEPVLKLIFTQIQVMAFFLFVAFIYCHSPAFRMYRDRPLQMRHLGLLYLFFSAISVAGTYLGVPVQGALANSRAIGPVLAGLLGGPGLGGAVGLTAGLHRYHYGGFTALACGLSTTVEGLVGGLVLVWASRRGEAEGALSPSLAFLAMVLAEALQMLIILAVARPFTEALALVRVIAIPMILTNSVGAALFMSILRDRRALYEQVDATTTERTLRIAQRTLNLLAKGFTPEVAPSLARIILEETRVGAVAITDRTQVLAFIGLGEDHHVAGNAILSCWSHQAIQRAEVVFLDGVRDRFECRHSATCPLRSALVVPLVLDGEVIGTIQLLEPHRKRFLAINRSLGEGLVNLLSAQLLRARYEEQKNLLVLSELKLAHAQVNPHFLFNALTTIQAIVRKDPARARGLLNHLSSFFRMNLKRVGEFATLDEELAHVGAYLEIEKARFEDHLRVELDIDPALRSMSLPTFTLQPLVENAIKHGIAQRLEPGVVRIHAYREGSTACLEVEDSAGAYAETSRQDTGGLGLEIVGKRIRSLPGATLTVSCVPEVRTCVTLRIPLGECQP